MHDHCGSSCYRDEPARNGSKAVSLLLRLCTLVLAITSAVVMAASSDCTSAVAGDLPRNVGGVATATVTSYSHYGAFVHLVGFNITAAILEAAAIYLQLSLGGVVGDEEEAAEVEGSKLPRIILVVVDVLVLALLYPATAAVYAAASAYGAQIKGCTRFGVQVEQSKILSLAASAAIALAAVAKDVPLPFNVPPLLA